MENFQLKVQEDLALNAYRWAAAGPPQGSVVIVHGLGEYALRYQRLAQRLADAGFCVLACDLRGSGPQAERLGEFGPGGWQAMVADLEKMVAHESGRPVFLLGHSMGSMLAHHFLTSNSGSLTGAVLSGSPGFPPWLQARAFLLVTAFERWRLGPDAYSERLRWLMFGMTNKKFDGPGATGFEWLSRDETTVQGYVADPLCGFTPTCGSAHDWFYQYQGAIKPDAVAGIRPDLPVLFLSGADDPLNAGLKNIQRQLAAYQGAGLSPDTRFYPGGRHEMFNEINRDEVITDLIGWLQKHTPQPEQDH